MNKEKKYTDYKVKITKGTVGDQVTEWMTPAELEEFNAEHNKYVEELKAKGEYLKEEEVTIKVEHCPLFDNPPPGHGEVLESYRMELIDFSKDV